MVRYSCKAGLRNLKLASLKDEWSEGQPPGLAANSKGITSMGLPDDISGQRAENERESV